MKDYQNNSPSHDIENEIKYLNLFVHTHYKKTEFALSLNIRDEKFCKLKIFHR